MEVGEEEAGLPLGGTQLEEGTPRDKLRKDVVEAEERRETEVAEKIAASKDAAAKSDAARQIASGPPHSSCCSWGSARCWHSGATSTGTT